MDQIDVYWLSYHDDVLARGYWDNGLLEDLFKRGNFNHIEVKNRPFPEVELNAGGIVIINGRTHVEDIAKINADLAKLRWVVLLETGDEEAVFPLEQIRHPLIRTWVMLPRMNLHNDVSFKMPNGYRSGTSDMLKAVGNQPRTIDFMFVGQVNHARREQCMEAAQLIKHEYSASLIGTDGFGKEALNQQQYMATMARTKIALCPSGIESPDNFRLYEALEAGCLPVVDAFATNNQDWGFWQYLFGSDIPFPIVPYWDELPKLMPELIKGYPGNANKAFAWWQLYKRNMFNKLIDDVAEVSK